MVEVRYHGNKEMKKRYYNKGFNDGMKYTLRKFRIFMLLVNSKKELE